MGDIKGFELDLEELRAFGYAAVDLMLEMVAQEGTDPIMPEVSGRQVREAIDEALPLEGRPAAEVLDEVRNRLMPSDRRNGHPRFFGYVCSSADPVGAVADLLASTANQNLTAWRSAPAAVELERVVVRWLAAWIGFSAEGHGLLVSGGSAANLNALTCALGEIARRQGGALHDTAHLLTTYVSIQGHLSMAKALRLLGLPPDNIRQVPVDDNRQLDVVELDRMIEADLKDGMVPAVVCASAGTANTGAVDPLVELADLCTRRGLWFHIDGAYGAPAAVTDDYRWMQKAFARADSLSLDPHKWLFAPLDVGCVLVRDEKVLAAAFAVDSEYTRVTQQDPIERFAFFEKGLELSRRARALKVWMILKVHGTTGLSRVIAGNISLRCYLDERIASEPCLEAMGSGLSISCFRFRPHEAVGELDELNRRLLETLVGEGRIYMSPTTLEGQYCLRVCIVNFRTRREDIDLLIDEVVRIGTGLVADRE